MIKVRLSEFEVNKLAFRTALGRAHTDVLKLERLAEFSAVSGVPIAVCYYWAATELSVAPEHCLLRMAAILEERGEVLE